MVLNSFFERPDLSPLHLLTPDVIMTLPALRIDVVEVQGRVAKNGNSLQHDVHLLEII